MRDAKTRLRTRVGPDGMDYKGYNIAIHELGHNVEQTFSLNGIDHWWLNGVPNTAFTEALAFGKEQGLDMDKVIDLLGGGDAGSWFLKVRGPSMVHDRYAPGFRLALHHKDLKICQTMLAADEVQLPMVEMTLVHYERLMADGYGDEDISALYRIKRPLFGDEV